MATDEFLKACGIPGPLVLEITEAGSDDVERRVVSQPYVLIGRDPRADLMLDHELVSRRHAYLQMIAGRLFWIDLDSRTGTGVGGQTAESGWLEPGESLAVGPYLVRLDGDPSLDPGPQSSSPLAAISADASGLPSVALEFQSRSNDYPAWRMSQVLAVMGTSDRCKVRLRDRSISKLHCALVRTPEGLWTVDLLGRGGITVNGAPTRAGRLNHGDYLGLGQIIIRTNFEGVGSEIAPTNPPFPSTSRDLSAGPGARVPSAFNPPKAQAPAELAITGGDPSLAMLLNHFGQMQQQMLDQFQSSMLMMMQMFGGMHREQMGLVRDELEQLRSLNTEIADIKSEMARGPRSAPQTPAVPPWPALANGHAAASKPAPPPPKTAPPPPRIAPKPPSVEKKDVAADSAPPSANAPLEPPAPAIQDWLNDRLATITEEQQTRWQRIMEILSGNRGK